MKKIVGKYLYDTHKAKQVACVERWAKGYEFGGYGSGLFLTMRLYKTPSGRWFLHEVAERNNGWFKDNWHITSEHLEPMNLKEAQKWAMKEGVKFSKSGIPEPEAA